MEELVALVVGVSVRLSLTVTCAICAVVCSACLTPEPAPLERVKLREFRTLSCVTNQNWSFIFYVTGVNLMYYTVVYTTAIYTNDII